jgi:predicted PurR-regulated permease PerM
MLDVLGLASFFADCSVLRGRDHRDLTSRNAMVLSTGCVRALLTVASHEVDEVSMAQPETIRNRLLTVIAVVLVVAALKWSYPVTMPLVVAVFVIATAWPIKPWLDQMLPSSLSYVGTVLALFLILACFIVVIYFAIAQVAQTFGQNQEQFRALYGTYAMWAQERGLPVLGGEGGYDRLVAIAQILFWRAYAVLGYLGFIVVLMIMGLPEVPALARKFRDQL